MKLFDGIDPVAEDVLRVAVAHFRAKKTFPAFAELTAELKETFGTELSEVQTAAVCEELRQRGLVVGSPRTKPLAPTKEADAWYDGGSQPEPVPEKKPAPRSRSVARREAAMAKPQAEVVETEPFDEDKPESGSIRLSKVLGEMYAVQPGELYNLVAKNIINVSDGPPATPAEVYLVMHTMHKYDLDPFMKQIHAFRDKWGRIQIVVGYDGRVAIANRPANKAILHHVSYRYGKLVDGETVHKSLSGRRVFEYVVAIGHLTDGSTVEIPVFAHEWFVNNQNWISYFNHRLRCKGYSMIVREVLGIDVLDEFDEEQFARITDLPSRMAGSTSRAIDRLNGSLGSPLGDDIAKQDPRHPEHPAFDSDDPGAFEEVMHEDEGFR